ncbi:MAG: hypothetical protein FWH57_11270, partial [Oscillospiraceae bacterium]|nr:hypothetical protein [Oscillospiraceae bacterium]
MKAKKFLSILLTLAITLSLLPAITIPVHAARVLNFVVNGRTYENLSPGSFSTMFFGGYEWYALDKMPDSDQWLIDELYLVAKTDVFGTTAYRQLIKNPTGDYYDNLNSSNPNDYSGSTLQGKMDWIKNSMPAHDRNMLINRSLDKINGPAVTAGVWPLSEDETRLLGYYSQFPRDYWLRTGYSQTWLSSTSALVQRADGGKISTSLLGGDYWTVDKERAIRPACYIDTRNMFFAFPESSLVRARPFLSYELTALEKNQIKLRAYNSSLDISLYPTDLQMTGTNGLFTFDYRNASTGADRHISCILTDMNDNVMGYCKLKYVGTPVDESGVVTIEIPYQAIGAGQYKLKIFTEQSYQYGTNLCSRPVEITFNCAADGNLAVQSAPKSAPLLKLESATVESDGSVTVSFYGNKGGFDSYYYYTVAPHWYEAYDIVMEELVITPLLVAINSSDPNAHEIMNDGTNTIHVGPIPQGYNLYILAANYANRSNLLSVDVNPRVGVFEILDWDVLAAIQTNIDNLLGYFNQPGDVIQIKGAGWDRQPPPPSLPHALTPLYINIPQGVTVEWYAESIGETDGIWDIGMVE